MGWINKNKKLPTESEDVLVYGRLGYKDKLVICCYEDGVWYDSENGQFITHVVFWQPLPKAPKKLC